MYDQQRLRPVCAHALDYSITIKLLTEHHLEFLSLKGGYTGSSESINSCQNATFLEITCHGSYVVVQRGVV